MSRLLVVEDEAHIASGLRFNLEADGHAVEVADTGEAALKMLAADPAVVDLVVLDVMLPGIDGFSVAREMRGKGWLIPILMLTARGRAEDVLRGFEAGADDYLPKPFELSILLARVNALLRRHRNAWRAANAARYSSSSIGTGGTGAAAAAPAVPDTFVFNGRKVDFDAQELHARGKKYPLTLMEANLLRYLVQHEGRAVSRKSMLEDVWNLHEDTDTRAIDHFIARLRKYIEAKPSHPKHLQTVRSVGYRFVANPTK